MRLCCCSVWFCPEGEGCQRFHACCSVTVIELCSPSLLKNAVVEMLASHGLQSTVVSEPLTPIQASRRYPRSVSVGELLGGPMLWAALVIAVFAIAWVFWIVLR